MALGSNLLRGRSAVAYGTKASIDFDTASGNTESWPGAAVGAGGPTPSGVGVDIVGYTLTDATEVDTVVGANGVTLAKGFAERKLQLQCEIIAYGSSEAEAKAISFPPTLSIVTIQGADNAAINGDWNLLEGASWTGESNAFKRGTITLERYSGTDFADANMVALSTIS